MRRTVLFVSSNGAGLGHLTRQMAVARRLSDRFRPVFHTQAHALALVRAAGIPVVHTQHHDAAGCPMDAWNDALEADLLALGRRLDPAAVVVDSTALFGGFAGFLQRINPVPRVWVRRAFWSEENRFFLDLAPLFDRIVEPGDLADALDTGPTTTMAEGVVKVPPTLLVDPQDRLDRDAARRALGLPADGAVVALQLGYSFGARTDALRAQVLAALTGRADLTVVDIRSPLEPRGNGPARPPEGVRQVDLFPSFPVSRAFDALIVPAGYNSFHEAVLGGIPALFLANTSAGMDRQDLRAAWAEASGFGLGLPVDAPGQTVAAAVERLLSPAFEAGRRKAADRIAWSNGASAIARIIEEIADGG
ncbi:glycosyltransferase [Mongoliimonas terrestris]|uniref:glycosyltransferase n=1 Tax=Mongoliimonas terrestris TaxID=1709001 RepID=UPI000949AF04|nr:hypothetical protein [Mongoliimonas terrestris]